MTRRLPKPKPRWVWITVSTVIPAAVLGVTLAGVLSEAFRDWLLADESGSTTIRNLGLVLAGLIALPLAIWRGLVAEKQADAAQRSLRNERYQKGAEMLGSEVLTVRLGGIYALQRLGQEFPEEYHVQTMRLLCAFVRNLTSDMRHKGTLAQSIETSRDSWIREDVLAAMTCIGKRDDFRISLERKAAYRLELAGINLKYLTLLKGNLRKAMLPNSNLSMTMLVNANLSEAFLQESDLTGTDLTDADLSGTLLGASELQTDGRQKVSIYSLGPAFGISQTQLDQARADPNNPPILFGVLDPNTGQPLVWNGGRGAPLKDDE